MLQLSTIQPATLDLLKKLLVIPELKDFYLVGGTALALKYGHRLSVDLDLFSTQDFDKENLIQIIVKHFPQTEYKNDNNPVGFFCFINNVKVDLVKHHYFNQIDKPDIIDGIRMFGDKDIIAMKIFAILKRAKKKDFYDLAELMKKYSLKDMLDFYKKKYPDHMLLISIPYALTYFADAEEDEDPLTILNSQSWESVKKQIQKTVRDFLS